MTLKNENPDLLKPVIAENEFKTWLVNYVGEKLKPENDEVNVDMIIQVISEEFPEFLLTLAEENWVNGYTQALNDVKFVESEMKKQNVTEKCN